jgi:GntR family transcriptional repressor for pyruvate dehydrogenase complex
MKHHLHSRLPDQLAQQLERAIVQRAFLPGQRLPPERVWAAQLGASRATLREALRLLAERGWVVQRHGAGTFVAEQPGRQAQGEVWAQLLQRQPLMQTDWLEFREMLEIRCAELAAQRATPEDLARLAQTHAEVDAAYAANERQTQVRADVAFHRTLADATRNPVFSHLVATLLAVLHEHVLLSIADLAPNSEEAQALRQQHQALWQAVAARDAPGAAQAARQHIAYVRQRWQKRLTGE